MGAGRDPTLGEVEECNSACEGEGTGTHTAATMMTLPIINHHPSAAAHPVCLVTLAP